MPLSDTPGAPHVTHSPESTSAPPTGLKDAQLSGFAGVSAGVSSVAIDRGLLALAGVPQSTTGTTLSDSISDAEVMLLVKTGDESAFAYLVHKYRRQMVGFMYRMCHNPATAEELAQEVFLRVYRSRASYEASAKFNTWLYRIATNLAVNHARDTRHERPEVQVSLDEPDEESGTTLELPDATPSAEQTMVRRERLMAIRRRVEALPEQQKLAVIMHKYQQMDYKQIDDVLKKSESATK